MKNNKMLRNEIIKFFIILTFISCHDQNIIEPETEQLSPYTIRYGESLTLPTLDLKIGFLGIIEESRCPIHVMCFWEGRAMIDVRMQTSTIDSIIITPTIYGSCRKEDSLCHHPIDTVGYRVTLLQLDPYPVYGDTTHTIADYTALISIVKK